MTREKNNCSNHTHQHPMETPRHHLHSGSPLFHLSGGHIFETHLPLGSFIYTAAGHWSSFAGGPQQYWPCFRWDAMRWRLRWMWWRRRRWQPGISSLSSFSSLSSLSSLSFTSRISLSTTLRQLLPAVMWCLMDISHEQFYWISYDNHMIIIEYSVNSSHTLTFNPIHKHHQTSRCRPNFIKLRIPFFSLIFHK